MSVPQGAVSLLLEEEGVVESVAMCLSLGRGLAREAGLKALCSIAGM